MNPLSLLLPDRFLSVLGCRVLPNGFLCGFFLLPVARYGFQLLPMASYNPSFLLILPMNALSFLLLDVAWWFPLVS